MEMSGKNVEIREQIVVKSFGWECDIHFLPCMLQTGNKCFMPPLLCALFRITGSSKRRGEFGDVYDETCPSVGSN